MFRVSFDRSMLENVEERPIVCVHAYADSSLRTRLAFMRVRLGFMHTQTYSCVRMLSAHIRRHEPACICCQLRTIF